MKFPSLKGANRTETLERIIIFIIVIGAIALASGIGLTTISTTGLPAIITLAGSFVVFIFSVALVLLWFFKRRE